MKLGVYVGSFNPVHKGHIKIINHLLDNNYLDKVLVIPTGNYWDKNNLIGIDDRINMLKMYENDKVIIDTIHNDLEYTYLIFRKLKEEYKDDVLYLVMGADNIVEFNKWKEYKELLLYNFIIINRGKVEVESYLRKLNKLENVQVINNLPLIDISSTEIRNKIINDDYENLDEVINVKVLNYINNKNLFSKGR